MAPTRSDGLLARVDFPLYTLQTLTNRHVLVAGGGGASKTGVANGFVSKNLRNQSKHHRLPSSSFVTCHLRYLCCNPIFFRLLALSACSGLLWSDSIQFCRKYSSYPTTGVDSSPKRWCVTRLVLTWWWTARCGRCRTARIWQRARRATASSTGSTSAWWTRLRCAEEALKRRMASFDGAAEQFPRTTTSRRRTEIATRQRNGYRLKYGRLKVYRLILGELGFWWVIWFYLVLSGTGIDKISCSDVASALINTVSRCSRKIYDFFKGGTNFCGQVKILCKAKLWIVIWS